MGARHVAWEGFAGDFLHSIGAACVPFSLFHGLVVMALPKSLTEEMASDSYPTEWRAWNVCFT